MSTDLQRAHAEIRSHFIAPGAEVPASFEEAMADEMWAALVRARAANNRYHARLAARRAGLAIHHRETPMPTDLIEDHQTTIEAQHNPHPVPQQVRVKAQEMYRSAVQRIADWEHILNAAAERGLTRLHASMDSMGEMTVAIHSDIAGRWVAHLHRHGYSFSDPVAVRAIADGHCMQARSMDGSRINLHVIEIAS